MGVVIIVYLLILILELSIGCSFIAWKCTASWLELECKLAIGGTILGISIWMLMVLLCPCFMSPCEICDAIDNVIEKLSHYFGKSQTSKHQKLYINNEVYQPTTESLLSNRHEDSVFNNEDNTYISYKQETKRTLSRHKFAFRRTDKSVTHSESYTKTVLQKTNDRREIIRV